MIPRIRKCLLQQGFSQADIDNEPQLSCLARWTPFSCATFGTIGVALASIGTTFCPCAISGILGLWAGSGWFFLALGLLTLTGGCTKSSIFDRLYNLVLRPFIGARIPEHGAPRQFGCAIGGIMYVLSGFGFLIGNRWVAYVPAGFMIIFATIAALTQWCFASAIYALLFGTVQQNEPAK